jgi:hypothetical protein
MNKCKKKLLPHQTGQPLPGILKLGDTWICAFAGTEEFSGLLLREVRTAGGEKKAADFLIDSEHRSAICFWGSKLPES